MSEPLVFKRGMLYQTLVDVYGNVFPGLQLCQVHKSNFVLFLRPIEKPFENSYLFLDIRRNIIFMASFSSDFEIKKITDHCYSINTKIVRHDF